MQALHVNSGRMRALVVGGAVRDAVLSHEPQDIDLEVYGMNYEDLAAVLQQYGRMDLVGKKRARRGRHDGPGAMAANAKSDGYTVSQLPITVFRLPFIQKTSFDPAKDFTYIIHLTGYTFGVVVKSDSSWKTFPHLLADAKANPGKINYGTPGAGTSPHITMEQIAKQQGIKWTHVPFKGVAESTNALLGGHIYAVADSTRGGPRW